jgi:choline dehydrogenase-like flavoprotein
VRAKLVVLAAGGVGTPIILLRQNLANSSGQVGRNFQVTPHFFVVGEFADPVESYYGLPTSWVLHQFEEVRGDEGGYMIQGIFAQAGMIATLLPGFGAQHRELMRRIPHFAALLSLLDDEEPGRVTLHETGRANVDYHVRGRDIPKARDFFRKAAKILLAAGAKRVLVADKRRTQISSESELKKIEALDFTPGNIPFVGTSNLGTCRMGNDPKQHVVDSSGKTHDIDGLYIVDASVLPTSTAVDPSVTIMANSLRIADGVLRTWDSV